MSVLNSFPMPNVTTHVAAQSKQPKLLDMNLQRKVTRVSQLFYAPDSDVTFESCDGVLFHIHRRYLEANTGGFPPSGVSTQGENVSLSESSMVLELLFQFVYPQRHPSLANASFSLLAPLAEAAEKYEVYSAMNICHIRMCNFISQHPTETLKYATKHDYPDLISEAAPLIIGKPLSKILQILPLHLVHPWVKFQEEWNKVHSAAFKSFEKEHNIRGGFSCSTWDGIWPEVLIRLGEGVNSIVKSQETFDPLSIEKVTKTTCGDCCKSALLSWRQNVEKGINGVPKFNSFL